MNRLLWLVPLAWVLAAGPAAAQTDAIAGRPVTMQMDITVERDKAGKSQRRITDNLEWDVGVGFQVLPDIAVCVKAEGRDRLCTPGFDPEARGDTPQRAQCPDSLRCRVTFPNMPYEAPFRVTIYDVDLKDHDIIGASTCTVGQAFCTVGKASIRMDLTGAPSPCELGERSYKSTVGQIGLWRQRTDAHPERVAWARREAPARLARVTSGVSDAIRQQLGKEAGRFPEPLPLELAEWLMPRLRAAMVRENDGRSPTIPLRSVMGHNVRAAFDEAEKDDKFRRLVRFLRRDNDYDLMKAIDAVLLAEVELFEALVAADDEARVERGLRQWRAAIDKNGRDILQRLGHSKCAGVDQLPEEFERLLKEADRR